MPNRQKGFTQIAKKSNIRSIRFSDEMTEVIEAQAGDNFTQKFENLVTRCMWELPHRQKELEAINIQITQKRQQLRNLQAATYQLETFQRQLANAKSYFTQIEQSAKYIMEKCNTD